MLWTVHNVYNSVYANEFEVLMGDGILAIWSSVIPILHSISLSSHLYLVDKCFIISLCVLGLKFSIVNGIKLCVRVLKIKHVQSESFKSNMSLNMSVISC